MNKKEKIVLGTTCFFAATALWILIVAIKKGVCCRNKSINKEDDEAIPEDGENIDEIDKILDKVNEAINNVTKEKNEEVVDSEEI